MWKPQKAVFRVKCILRTSYKILRSCIVHRNYILFRNTASLKDQIIYVLNKHMDEQMSVWLVYPSTPGQVNSECSPDSGLNARKCASSVP